MIYTLDPPPQYKTLSALLDTHTKDHLTKLGSCLQRCLTQSHFSIRGKSKASMVAGLVEHIVQPEHLALIIKNLNSAEISLLQETLYLPRQFLAMGALAFQAKYACRKPDLNFNPGAFSSRRKQEAISGLLLLMSPQGTLPADLKKPLKKQISRPKPFRAETTKDLPPAVEHPLYLGQQSALINLPTLLQGIESHKIQASLTTHAPTKKSMLVLKSLINGEDFSVILPEDPHAEPFDLKTIQAYGWTQLLINGGWVQLNGTRLVLTPKGKKHLQNPLRDGLKSLWEDWLKTTKKNEFYRIDLIKGKKSRPNPLHPAPPARQAIAKALRLLPPGQWIAYPEFVRLLLASGFAFEIVRNPYALYLSEPEYDNLGELGTWHHSEGRFLLCFLVEYAATLGLIDMALDMPWNSPANRQDGYLMDCDLEYLSLYDGLAYLRLTDLGAWILELTPDFSPPAPVINRLIIKPDKTLVFEKECERVTQLFLKRIAHPLSPQCWQLDAEGLLKSLEEGLEMKKVFDFFTHHDAITPKKIEEWLRGIAQRLEDVQNEGYHLVVSVKDHAMQQELTQHKKIKPYCLPAGQRRIVVKLGKETLFRKALRSMGYVLP